MIDDTLLDTEEKMEKAVAVAKEEFGVIRTGRAHPAMFNKLTAEYYGTQTLDKSSTAAIERSIRDSDLGVNPTNDGNVIRVVFPDLTEERRREYIKVARHKAEDSRVSIRNIRRHGKDAIDKLVKNGDEGEDDGRRAVHELDNLTKTYVDQVDDLLKNKEAELLEV
jgi:ribosome recycling factor